MAVRTEINREDLFWKGSAREGTTQHRTGDMPVRKARVIRPENWRDEEFRRYSPSSRYEDGTGLL